MSVFAAIEDGGFYPSVISDALRDALAEEDVEAFVVQHEPTFDHHEEVRRHMTVLALTSTRLINVHTDEHLGDPQGFTTTAVEAVSLPHIASVVLTRMVPDGASEIGEALLSISWGSVSRVDVEPATCPDPHCEADHGMTGTITADDFSLRISRAADGPDAVDQLLDLSKKLSLATAQR